MKESILSGGRPQRTSGLELTLYLIPVLHLSPRRKGIRVNRVLLALAALLTLSGAHLASATDYVLHPGFPISINTWIESNTSHSRHRQRWEQRIASGDLRGRSALLMLRFSTRRIPLTSGASEPVGLGDLNHDGNLEIAAGWNRPIRCWTERVHLASGWHTAAWVASGNRVLPG
jgi:hypothetical protein